MKDMMATQALPPKGKTISIERTVPGSLEDVWAMWTTREGLESWWGPDGFETKVTALDLRRDGEWVYVMTAVAPQQAEFMKRANMPLSTETRVKYTDVSEPSRLAYTMLVDFVPGLEPYEVTTAVALNPDGDGTKLTIQLGAMHDETWTERARAGHVSQLENLAGILAAKADPARS